MKKKIIYISSILILIILLSLFFYLYFFRVKEVVYYWRTSDIEKGDVSLIVTATGIVSADTTVAIGTQVTGILSKLYVDFNSIVKKNQIIAQIDTNILHATKEEIQASFERAKIQLDSYTRDFERQKNLKNSNVISQVDYDIALTNYETAKSNLKAVKAQLDKAIINLHYATIRSPINGFVISRNLDQGQTVIASFNTPTLFTVVNNLKKMQVQANVSEADIGDVKIGQDVDFTVDAFPNKIFKGHVQQIRLQPVILQNVVNYVVIIDAANPNLILIPGLTASINIKIKHQSNVFKVSANALSFIPPKEYFENNFNMSDSLKNRWLKKIDFAYNKTFSIDSLISYLWVKNGNEIYPVAILKGLSDGIYTEIKGNIKVGQEVVTGINHSEASTDKSTKQNPFLPKFPNRSRKI